MITSIILCSANTLFLFALMDDDFCRRAITHPTFKHNKLAQKFNALLNFCRITTPFATSCFIVWILHEVLLTADPTSQVVFYIGGLLMYICSTQLISSLLEHWLNQQILRFLNNKHPQSQFAFNVERNIHKLLNQGGTALLLQTTGQILGVRINDDGELNTQKLTVDFTHQELAHA